MCLLLCQYWSCSWCFMLQIKKKWPENVAAKDYCWFLVFVSFLCGSFLLFRSVIFVEAPTVTSRLWELSQHAQSGSVHLQAALPSTCLVSVGFVYSISVLTFCVLFLQRSPQLSLHMLKPRSKQGALTISEPQTLAARFSLPTPCPHETWPKSVTISICSTSTVSHFPCYPIFQTSTGIMWACAALMAFILGRDLVLDAFFPSLFSVSQISNVLSFSVPASRPPVALCSATGQC